MIKYGFNTKKYNNSIFIFHSVPDKDSVLPYDLYSFQWYLTRNINETGTPINEEIYESFTITTEIIKERGLEGLYLYCIYTNKETNKESKTEHIKLQSDINRMIESGTTFDDISSFDSNGNLN